MRATTYAEDDEVWDGVAIGRNPDNVSFSRHGPAKRRPSGSPPDASSPRAPGNRWIARLEKGCGQMSRTARDRGTPAAPHTALNQTGLAVPASMTVGEVETGDGRGHLVLPRKPTDEPSDEALHEVAGRQYNISYTMNQLAQA